MTHVAVMGTGSAGMKHLAALKRLKGVHPIAVPQRNERLRQLEDMGYKFGLDAQILLMVAFHFADHALAELHKTGDYTGISQQEYVNRRQEIEDLIGLEEYYRIEEETVEKKAWGKR